MDAGGSVTFNLHASGTPPPNITWYRNGIQVSGSQYVGANSSQLTIKNASLADHGYFDCQVTSSGLKPAAARFFLGVLKCRVEFHFVFFKPGVIKNVMVMAGLKIMAGQWTTSGQNGDLTSQKLHVDQSCHVETITLFILE